MLIELPEEIENRLDALAKSTGRTKALVAQDAILSFLEDLDDLRVAEDRLADLVSGRATAIPLEDVIRKNGLAD